MSNNSLSLTDQKERILAEYENIQIDDDIKTKTQYFFRWLKFFQLSKTRKFLKLQQAENIKKAQQFSNYSYKFTMLMHWKKFIRIKKSERKKTQIIQQSKNRKYLKDFLKVVYEENQISKIYDTLEKITTKKLSMLGKNAALIKLQKYKNKMNKLGSQYFNVHKNIWCYRFLTLITQNKNLTTNNSKTYKKIKSLHEKQYNKLCLSKYFEVLAQNHRDFQEKIKQIKWNLIKKKVIQKIKDVKKNRSQSREKTLQCRKYRENHRKQLAISLMSFNYLKGKSKLQQLQLKLRSNQKNSNHLQQTVSQWSAKQLLEKNTDLTVKQIGISRQNAVFKNLKDNHNLKNQLLSKQQTIQSMLRKSSIKVLLKILLEKKLMKNKIVKFRQQGYQYTKYKIFNILRSQKQVNSYEKAILHKMYALFEKKQLFMCFTNLCQAAILNKNLLNFCNKTQKIIVRWSYYRMFSKSFVINKKVQKMKKQKHLQSLNYLFTLLQQISIHSKTLQQKTKNMMLMSNQKSLIEKLKRNHKIFKLNLQTVNMYEMHQQQLFFKCLLKKKYLEQCQSKMAKKTLVIMFLSKLNKKNQEKNMQNSDLTKKAIKLKNYLKSNYIYNFGKRLLNLWDHKQSKKQVSELIVIRTKLHALGTIIKNSLDYQQHNVFALQRKTAQVKKIHFSKFLSYLSYLRKYSKTQQMMEKSLKQQFFTNLSQRYSQNCQKNCCRVVFGINMIKKQIKRNKINEQKRQEERIKLQQFHEMEKKFLLKKAEFLFDSLMLHKAIKGKSGTIQQKFKNKNMMHFIKQSFQHKSQKIKMKIAIIHYARKLKQKAINALYEKNHEQKQKQNSLKKYRNEEGILKMERILEKSRRSNKLSDKISRFNMNISRSRKVMR